MEVSKSIKICKLHHCLTFLSGTLEKLSKSRSHYGKLFSKRCFFPKFTGLPDMRILIDRMAKPLHLKWLVGSPVTEFIQL